jgi:SAM-dependent methyltransferase
MHSGTAHYYHHNARQLARQYHQANPLYLAHLKTLLPVIDGMSRPTVLDVGCGTGRDVADLIRAGYDATGVDPSPEMLAAGRATYQLTTSHLKEDILPDLATVSGATFDGILCSAVLQHVPEEHLLDALYRLRSLVRPGGFLILSVPVRYPGITASGTDANGRLFILRPPGQYAFFLERLGLTKLVSFEVDDQLGRPGIAFQTLVFTAGVGAGVSLKPVETIESVLWDDRKVTTYKFALVRSLAFLATHRHQAATWHRDTETVSLDINEIATLWLQYYWPLMVPGRNRVILQGQTSRDGSRADIAFRPLLRDLAGIWEQQGGYSAFRVARDAGKLPVQSKSILKDLLQKIRTAIQQPVRYAGNERTGPLFHHYQGRVYLPERIWTELSHLGRWIEDSVAIRWAEYTASLPGNSTEILFPHVLELLLGSHEDQRETNLARETFQRHLSTNQLTCAWTDQPLRAFDVDHAIPWSLWHNNDLWNLLPADPRANNQKRDKLPSRTRILDRRRAIIGSWELLYQDHRTLFLSHASAFAGQRLASFNTQERALLFNTFKDAVEYTAVNRGVARW